MADQVLYAEPFVAFDDQAEAEVVRRNAYRAAAGAGVADEIGDVGAMLSFYDARVAIGAFRGDIAAVVEHVTREAGARPFPNVPPEILQAAFVGTEASVAIEE